MSEWQPIETALRDGSRIILLVNGVAVQGFWEPPKGLFTGAFKMDAEIMQDCGCCPLDREDVQVTHWMALPPPPT